MASDPQTQLTDPSGSSGSSESGQGFVHLHLHSQYSLLQGAIPTDEICERIQALGMSSVALTDTNNLFGAIDFYLKAKKAGVHPILGCEILYAPQGKAAALAPSQAAGAGGVRDVPMGPRFHHLVLLCKDYRGYQNLCQIVTRAYTEAPPPQKGAPSGPRSLVDRELLDRYGDGLIVLSGCLRGELSYKILTGDEESALESFHWFRKRFGEDFYLELQDHGLPEQAQVNQVLAAWGEKYGVACVATNDCHYLEECHHEAHEILQCIESGRNLDFDRPKTLVPAEYHLKSPAEMRSRFEAYPEACDETLRIAEKCKVEFRFKDEKGRSIYHLPNFRPDSVAPGEPFDLIAYFRSEARKGLAERFEQYDFRSKRESAAWPEELKEYEARLEEELTMIERTGFSGYFLIVADFIQWAKKNGIPVGPGRGSGAGSLVAYALKITDIDPIRFKLLFERFINPERISMPDFDIDFCQDRRGEVIDYVGRKYGTEKVSQIITFGKLQTRAVIKDVGRVLGFSFAETDALTKLIPEELGISISEAIEKEPRLRERIEQDPKTSTWIKYALALEGLNRSAGMHAAGVIITEEPVVSYCPLYVGRDGAVVTQFDKDSAEAIGLVKFDFLGLKTLTVIDHAVKLIRQTAQTGTREADFDLATIDDTDPAVYALLSSGDTDGVFQVESDGMKDLCMRMQPSSLDDITAICALYRPGPLGSGMVDDYIDCKHGRKPMRFDLPQLEPILKETYGIILYQEQVMQIARELAGYSLGQADMLRRAMGKKKPEEMAKQREIFCAGAKSKGIDPAKAESIFDLMAKFAEYGFNKSHSAAYGMLTYQTAFLKTHFPAEFMAALMTTEMSNTDKITKYISDSRSHEIPVLPPDVNLSDRRFGVEWVNPGHEAYPTGKNSPKGDEKPIKGIRCGLEAIKGVGGSAVDAILEARQQGGLFPSVLELAKRVSTRKANKKVLESLTLSGALDSIAEVNRASLYASLEGLLEFASDEQEERELGQSSLFDSFSAEEVKRVTPTAAIFKQEPDWPRSQALLKEKQVVGFFVSGHPMDPWQKICEEWLGWSTEKLKAHAVEKAKAKPTPPPGGGSPGEGFVPRQFRAPKQEVRLGGLLSEPREVMTKKGSRMGFAQLEDLLGRLEVVFFPEAYASQQEALKRATSEAEPVVITGDIELGEEVPKILVKTIEWMEEAHRSRVQQVVLNLEPSRTSGDQLRALKKSLLTFRGKCPVRIDFVDPTFRTRLTLPKSVGVAASPQFVESVERIFGRKNVVTLL
jgi:DNA polymerase-3 subunit alpha